MGMTIIQIVSSENHNNQEGDQETEEEAKGTESLLTLENLQVTENHPIKDKDLTADRADRVVTTMGPQMKTTLKNPTDQKIVEVSEEEEVGDTNPKRTEEVSMAMVAGVEKSARRP